MDGMIAPPRVAEGPVGMPPAYPAGPTMYKDPGPAIKGLIHVMTKVKEISKSGWNKEGKYEYVMAADLNAALQDALVSAGVFITQREVGRVIANKILFIHYQFDVHHPEGSIFNVGSHTGACRFEFKSGTTDDKAASKAFVSAAKYWYLGAFKIPTDDNNTERADDAGDADGQHGDREPESRNDPPRDSRRYREEPPPGPPASSEPPPGPPPGPPPSDWDMPERRSEPAPPPPEPPYGDRGAPTRGAPLGVAEAANTHRDRVMQFKEAILHAVDENAAHDIWRQSAELLRQMADTTYEWLRTSYEKQWGIFPPSV